jgi:protein TonB
MTHIGQSTGQAEVEHPVPLTLEMFRQAEPAPPEPVPAPDAAVQNEQHNTPRKKERPRPASKSRPAPRIPAKPAIAPTPQPAPPQPEPAITHHAPTPARPEPQTHATAEQHPPPTTGLRAQQANVKQHYLDRLLRRIHKLKHYPRRSRRHREEGEVVVSFVIEPSGEITHIRVSRSSGYDRLDQAARNTITRLNPAAPIPTELGISRWELAVPIAFNLRNNF